MQTMSIADFPRSFLDSFYEPSSTVDRPLTAPSFASAWTKRPCAKPMSPARKRLEAFVAEIGDVVFESAVLHGIHGSTIDFEINVWKRLEKAMADLADEYARSPFGSDHWIAVLARAAYEAVLQNGFDGSFLDLQLSLWRAVKNTVRRTRPFINE